MIVTLEILKKAKKTGADLYKPIQGDLKAGVLYIPQEITRCFPENEPVPVLIMTLKNINDFPQEKNAKKLVLAQPAKTGYDKYESCDKIISGLYLPQSLRSIEQLGVAFEK